MDEHEAAVRATTRRYRKTEAAQREARDAAIAAALGALRAGCRPTDVVEWSPFTATHVRKLAREAGLPPATKRRRSPR